MSSLISSSSPSSASPVAVDDDAELDEEVQQQQPGEDRRSGCPAILAVEQLHRHHHPRGRQQVQQDYEEGFVLPLQGNVQIDARLVHIENGGQGEVKVVEAVDDDEEELQTFEY